MIRDEYRPDSYNVICQRCGFKYKIEQVRKEWTGLLVCTGPRTNDCWEERNPADLSRPTRPLRKLAWTRPEQPDQFIEYDPVFVTISGVSGTGTAGNLTYGISKAITGNSATGSVGTLQLNCNCNLHTTTIQPDPPYGYKWNAVASDLNGTEVAVCTRNRAGSGQSDDQPNFAYSTDGGQTWNEATITSGPLTDINWVSVKWNGTYWAAYCGGDSRYARSTDGINWTVTASSGTFNPWGVSFYNTALGVLPDNKFYGVYGNTDNARVLRSDNDGQSFDYLEVLPHSGRWSGVAHNGTNVVAVGQGASSGGTNEAAWSSIANMASAWTSATMPGSCQWQQVIWDGTYFVATASTNTAVRGARSLTGETWEEITLPTSVTNGASTLDIANYGQLITDDRGNLWLGIWRLSSAGTPTTTTHFFCSYNHGSTWSQIPYPASDMWLTLGWSGYRLYGLENRTDAVGGTDAWYSDER